VIGSLRGRLVGRAPTGEVLVEVQGLGYRVQAGPATAARLGDLDAEVFVWIHHHIRDDAQALYGFATEAERDTFEALLGAHGVGPALALAILSVHPPGALARIVADDDLTGLCLVPGVGRKTAARLLIELKSRLDGVTVAATSGRPAPDGTGDGQAPDRVALADVRDGLAGLGYGAEEIAEATRDLDGTDPGALLRQALQRLSSGR
jgi:Holliday junction DNA helicase RuvA